MHGHPAIGFDIDGVVLDYETGLFAFAESIGLRARAKPPEISAYQMELAFPEIGKEGAAELIRSFNSSEAFGALSPYEGAVATIRALSEEFPDAPIVAITSAGESDLTRSLRERSLSGFPFSAIHVIGIGETKRSHFEALPAGSCFVDDLAGHVFDAEAAGVAGILMRRAYNAEVEHSRVAETWHDVGRHVREVMDVWRANDRSDRAEAVIA